MLQKTLRETFQVSPVNRIVRSLLLLSLIAPVAMAQNAKPQPLRYTVDLSDTVNHVFAVSLQLPPLGASNDVFEFASTAPGTYQTMNIGRFVRGFQALDANGRELGAERIAVNRWRLLEPARVRQIRYGVKATRDTTVTEDPIYAMCGSRLVADYALINGQALFGFPKGMQATPLTIKLHYPATWRLGTALNERNGVFEADSYDHLVDSPILLGAKLSSAILDVTGVPVSITVQSRTGQVQASQLRDAMRDMLLSAGNFLGKLPVDRYTFLFDFGLPDRSAGAWEHSYSSEYVLPEFPYSPQFGARVTDIAAHEFFHVVTPLNIHSEIIEHFNFATPTPSQHLWLYEGTTEWAAHKMQLETGLKTLPEYLNTVVGKVQSDRTQYDTTYSLTKLAMTSFSDSGQRQYPNIYQRGAIVAGLLDIRLLELSGGKHGLRDLITDLSKQYGKKRAFPEDSLIDIIVARTSPEVRDFFTRYVRGTDHPPVKEYFAKLGITLIEDDKGLPVRFQLDPNATPEQVKLREAWMGPKARA